MCDVNSLLLGMALMQSMIGDEYSSQKMEDFLDIPKEETENDIPEADHE